MTWVRIDDRFAQHPKVVAAGPLAMAMQVAALGYCNRELTDGFVPRAIARTLLDMDPDAGVTADASSVIARLVEAGMWEVEHGGYRIHDYHEYQPSKEQVLRERELTRKRVESFRERNAVGNAVTNGSVTPAPVPVSRTRIPVGPLPEPDSLGERASAQKPKIKTMQKTQVPETWAPSSDHCLWARDQGFTQAEVTGETAKFVRHHRSKGSTFKDIGLAWQNWMERSREWGRSRASPGSNGKNNDPKPLFDLAKQYREEGQ